MDGYEGEEERRDSNDDNETRTNNVGRVAIMQDTKLSNDLLSNLWLDIQPNQFSCQLYTRLFMPYRLQMIVKGKRNKKRGRGLSE